MDILAFSLVLRGELYIEKFNKYSINSLYISILNFHENTKKKSEYIFFISTEDKDKEKITKIFEDSFINLNYQLIFDNNIAFKKKISYMTLTQLQKKHLVYSRNINAKYFLIIYSDLIFSKNAIYESYKVLINQNKSVVCSFALNLNINSHITTFLEKIKINDYFEYLLKNRLKLISNFHSKFEYGKHVNFTTNFIFYSKKNGILIKSQHVHPVIIKINQVKKNARLISLDENIEKLFKNSVKEIYIERDMKKISIFSCDYENHLRNSLNKSSNIYEKNKTFLKYYNILSLYRSISKSNQEIFFNNYIYFKMNDYLKVDSINKSLNFYLNKRVSTIKEKINNEKLIHVPFRLKIKVIFINILRVNFINENYFLKKVYEFIKINKNSKFNNKVVDNNLEYFLLIFKFYNFKNKLRFIFHL